MLSVRELIRELEKMPGDAKVLVHVKELGGFQRVEKVDLEDAKGFEWVDVEQVVILDEVSIPHRYCKNSRGIGQNRSYVRVSIPHRYCKNLSSVKRDLKMEFGFNSS